MRRVIKSMIQYFLPPHSKVYLLLHAWLNQPHFPSLNHALNYFANSQPEVFFVQIGAYEGSPNDPIYQYVFLKNWKGIFVEPQERAFASLKNHYVKAKKVWFENSAIAASNKSETFYYIKKEGENVPNWVDQLSSFHSPVPSAILKKYPQAQLCQRQVECITINTLLTKYKVEQLHFLMIDTEGHDFQILQSLDFEQWHPKMIIYEHCHLSDAEQTQAIQLLKQQGYYLYPAQFNTVAFTDETLAKEYQKYLI